MNITSPVTGTSIPVGGGLSVLGYATDVEGNPIPTDQMLWTYTAAGSSSPVQLGVGDSAPIFLLAGEFDVTLTAVDLNNDTTAQSTIHLTIIPGSVVNGNMLYLPSIVR